MKKSNSTSKKSESSKKSVPMKRSTAKKSVPKKSTMKKVGRVGILTRLKNKRVSRLETRLKKLSLVAD